MCSRAIPFLFMSLRTLLQYAKCYLFCFQAIPHSLQKLPGVGGGGCYVFSTFGRSDLQTFQRSPARPIAAERPWCNNERRRENSSPSGETTPLPPVSNYTERTSGTGRS